MLVMKNGIVIGGAAINNSETIAAIKEIQKGEGIHVQIITDTIDLLLIKKDYLQESSDIILQYMSDLNLIKTLLVKIECVDKQMFSDYNKNVI